MATFNKILLTGINGQVGHALYPKLQSLGEVIALDRNQLDLSKPDHIREVIQHIKPDLIINPAAYTAVDKAESEPELAHTINSTAPGILAEEAAKLGALLVHYSTDYVFDGTKTSPYVETDETNPLSVYGTSKLAGEKAIQAVDTSFLILRTSWVYGAYGKNFMRTILRLAAERDSLNIVADQFGAPTSSDSIADTTIAVLQAWDGTQSGVYHLVNADATSWHGFAEEIIRQYHALHQEKSWPPLAATKDNIIGIPSTEYPTAAHRPYNSRMSADKLRLTFDVQLLDWRHALTSVLSKHNFIQEK